MLPTKIRYVLLLLVAFTICTNLASADSFSIGVKLESTNLTLYGYTKSVSYNTTSNFTGNFTFDYDCTINSTYPELIGNLTTCWQRYTACSQSEANCQSFKVFWSDQQLYKENYTYCKDIELPRKEDEIRLLEQENNKWEMQWFNLNRTYSDTLKQVQDEKNKQLIWGVFGLAIGGVGIWIIFWRKKKTPAMARGPPQTGEYTSRY